MYEERFGTDWTTLDGREEAVERAFALGVAARLGEHHPNELDRINEAIDTTYDKSFVELAYHEGREKASEVAPQAEEDEQIWEELVEEKTVIDPDARPEPTVEDEEDDTIPDAVRGFDADTRPDDSTEAVERPSMLDRKKSGPNYGESSERTVFGRSRDDVETSSSDSREERDEASEGDAEDEGGDDSDDGESGDDGSDD